MAELRLMENCDIEECTELYLGAFHHDGKMGEYFRENLPLYFKKYIESDYCMAYVLTDGDSIIGIITAIIVPSIGMNSISVDTVAISPVYQHKGYGKQMFSEFFEKTRGSFYSLNTQRGGTGYRLYDKVGFSDETDRAYMIYMPGVTDRIKQLESELKAENSEKSGDQ